MLGSLSVACPCDFHQDDFSIYWHDFNNAADTVSCKSSLVKRTAGNHRPGKPDVPSWLNPRIAPPLGKGAEVNCPARMCDGTNWTIPPTWWPEL